MLIYIRGNNFIITGEVKTMPRLPRNNIKTSYFHVMVQGIDKEYIFNRKIDIKYYISILYELKDELNIKIIAYCIMNNHAHLLIHTNDVSNLTKYMHKTNTKYAIYYNKIHDRVGYVFRNRFKSEGIYSERQLYNCISYIYNNPVKAKICSTPEEYPYSNAKYYKGIIEENNLYSFLGMDNDKDYKKIIKTYLIENNMKKEDLIRHKESLKKLIVILRKNNKVSFRKMEEELEISRETLRKLIK